MYCTTDFLKGIADHNDKVKALCQQPARRDRGLLYFMDWFAK